MKEEQHMEFEIDVVEDEFVEIDLDREIEVEPE